MMVAKAGGLEVINLSFSSVFLQRALVSAIEPVSSGDVPDSDSHDFRKLDWNCVLKFPIDLLGIFMIAFGT